MIIDYQSDVPSLYRRLKPTELTGELLRAIRSSAGLTTRQAPRLIGVGKESLKLAESRPRIVQLTFANAAKALDYYGSLGFEVWIEADTTSAISDRRVAIVRSNASKASEG